MSAKLKPFINIGPGQILKREMESLNWSQEDLSEIIAMTPKSISQIINNKQSITIETAVMLGKAFNVSPEFWLNLEHNYRLRLRENDGKDEETEKKAQIRKYMPLNDMKNKGWIISDRSAESQIKAYCAFWDQDEADFSIYEKNLPYCARQQKTDEKFTEYYTRTWLHKAKSESLKIKTIKYNAVKLQKLAGSITDYTLKKNGVELFLNKLSDTGVIFIVLSHLKKTYLDGACFLNKKNPVVVYTARYNRLDNFWWTVSHEIAHILLHLKCSDDCFLDDLDDKSVLDKKENDADSLAGDFLKVKDLLKEAEPYKNYFPEKKVLEISDKTGIDPSLSVGILQFNEYLPYRSFNKFKKTVLDLIPDNYIKG